MNLVELRHLIVKNIRILATNRYCSNKYLLIVFIMSFFKEGNINNYQLPISTVHLRYPNDATAFFL